MIFKIVVKNIQNAFKSCRKIYLLLIISQLVSVISIFFMYGIYGSYTAKMQELDINSYTIGACFEEGNIGTLKKCLPEILNKISSKLDYVFISGFSEEMMISMYTEYHGGKYTLAELVTRDNIVKAGRLLTYEDAVYGRNVIYSHLTNEYSVGDIISIGETQFEVVGVDKRNVRDIVIPFNSCPDNVELVMCYFNFKKLPTQKDYYAIKNAFENSFRQFNIDEFELKDKEEIISYRTIIIISISIGIVSALNTCLLYGYIINRRRKQMVVYGIIGASKRRRLIINVLEVMFINIIVVMTGFAIFRIGLQDVITKVYENSVELYSIKAYIIMALIYILCIFIFTMVLLNIMNRKKLTDMLRRTKND